MARLKGMAGLLVAVAVVGVAIWLGARQGREDSEKGFEPPPSAQAPAPPPPPPAPFTSDQQQVRSLSTKAAFAHSCGACHTLRAAGVKGILGPDLDKVDDTLTFAFVRNQIRNGSLDSSMPANLLTGKDADRVARYVARVSQAGSG
jgi:mono/diheme cytochrome c family protein